MYFFMVFLKVLGSMIKVALRKYIIYKGKSQLIYPILLC